MEKEYSKDQVITEFEKLIRWIEQILLLSGRANGRDCKFEVGLLCLFLRTVELLKEDERSGNESIT